MTAYIALFPEIRPCLVLAENEDEAIKALERADVHDTPEKLVIVPPGVVVAEIRFAGDTDDDDELDLGGASDAGVVLEPFDPLIQFLDALPRDEEEGEEEEGDDDDEDDEDDDAESDADDDLVNPDGTAADVD